MSVNNCNPIFGQKGLLGIRGIAGTLDSPLRCGFPLLMCGFNPPSNPAILIPGPIPPGPRFPIRPAMLVLLLRIFGVLSKVTYLAACLKVRGRCVWIFLTLFFQEGPFVEVSSYEVMVVKSLLLQADHELQHRSSCFDFVDNCDVNSVMGF